MAAMAGGKRDSASKGDKSLLPKTYEEFGTKQYWEDFFKQREEKAFEWYGAYNDLSEFVAPVVARQDSVLVIGCGNSDFSTDMYLKGGHHHITNVDFSESVIEEMRSKTSLSCPGMSWQVMDVTAMTPFQDGQWDVVVDKGTLDAIYNTEENEPQADRMLDEVERVLSARGGRYLVVTLGQDFIFRKLLQRFGGGGDGGWSLAVHALEAKTGPRPGAGSAFLTLVAVATRQQSREAPASGAVSLAFDSTAKWVSKPITYGQGDHEAVLGHVVAAREWHHTRHQLQAIKPGRFKADVDIWMREGEGARGPRYTLSIVDIIPPTRTPEPCAVFIIPQDRNHEWLFSSADGLRQVAEGSQYERLICVRMNRGHKFMDLEEVKGELGSIVRDFFPANMDPKYLVPYLAVGEVDDGSRVEVDRGDLPLCGAYCVEEEEDSSGPSGSLLRRLVFLRNQHVIQTEVRLAPPKKASSSSGGSNKKKKGGSKKGGKGGSKEAATEGEAGPEAPALAMDFSYMCFDYHRAMLSGLWLIGSALKAAKAERRRLKVLVLGLGGGALPLFLSHYYPGVLDIVVMELEGGLRDVACRWFGFREHEGLSIEVGDGLAKVTTTAQAQPASYDVIMVDVDNKDASMGISCPGPEFLTTDFLQACRHLLKPSSGLLVMNLAARSTEAREAAMKGFREVFSSRLEAPPEASAAAAAAGEVLEIHPSDEDVNHVLFGLNTPRASSSKASTLALGLEKWLQESKTGSAGNTDPLELADLLTRVTAVKA